LFQSTASELTRRSDGLQQRAGLWLYDGGMVQMAKVAQIRADWVSEGEPLCTHESYDKEYALGGDTGDYACMTCGAEWQRGSDKPLPTGKGDAATASSP
jgi:hypothetical protein